MATLNDTVTLHDTRLLLEGALKHTDNPAILRLPEDERTVAGVARAYIGFGWWQSTPGNLAPPRHYCNPRMLRNTIGPSYEFVSTMMMSEPVTCKAVAIALALYLGLDPGEGGLGVSWQPVTDSTREERVVGWFIGVKYDARYFVLPEHLTGDDDEIDAPEVAVEPDARKALALAVKHVLATR